MAADHLPNRFVFSAWETPHEVESGSSKNDVLPLIFFCPVPGFFSNRLKPVLFHHMIRPSEHPVKLASDVGVSPVNMDHYV